MRTIISTYLPTMKSLTRLGIGVIASVLIAHTTQAQSLASSEYELIGYDNVAVDNRVAVLAEQLQQGTAKLNVSSQRGYFDSLLAALNIDPHSQVLVFSKTSLQYQLIDASTPRAIYFNDDTYIGWVQGSNIVEVMTLDAKLGMVFYVFNNATRDVIGDSARDAANGEPNAFERQQQRCLVCHDSNGAASGGIPMLLARSGIYNLRDINLLDLSGIDNTNDKTPLAKRWGGWYVSGLHGSQTHVGNMRVQGPEQLPALDTLLRGNLPTLAGQGLFDTTPYPTNTSDIVALMILEHQLTVVNQLTYVKFKAPAVLSRTKITDVSHTTHWADLPERGQRALTHMLDALVNALLFVDAVPLSAPIKGDADFQASFEARGPRDAAGRSLRELDLNTRLFRYPLSFLIYSPYFDSLPTYAKDYVHQQLATKPELSAFLSD
jgi:hypothetical protein